MNENEFELDGKVYVAVEDSNCDGCAFSAVTCSPTPPCHNEDRKDNKSVIFVEKQQ